MAGVADAKREALKLLDREEAAAWDAYLETTRGARRYETLEPWAWSRLQQRLRAIDARRGALNRRRK